MKRTLIPILFLINLKGEYLGHRFCNNIKNQFLESRHFIA